MQGGHGKVGMSRSHSCTEGLFLAERLGLMDTIGWDWIGVDGICLAAASTDAKARSVRCSSRSTQKRAAETAGAESSKVRISSSAAGRTTP
jgi:hypothetical protein